MLAMITCEVLISENRGFKERLWIDRDGPNIPDSSLRKVSFWGAQVCSHWYQGRSGYCLG